MPKMPRLIISATRGGSGKTTLTLGIVAAWRKQGRSIAVFKKGPDFIDAGWLGFAAGRPCYNLDLFMMDREPLVQSFVEHSAGCDAAVIEGNRGLFDGLDEVGTYSTARLAKILKTPVVLIVDCTKASSTVAAVVLGCRAYDPDIEIGGIILNNASPGRHETVIRKAIEQSSGLPVVGAVPRQRKGAFPERHMGLTPFQEHLDRESAIQASAAVAERHLDLDALWKIANRTDAIVAPERATTGTQRPTAEQPVIGVIRDSAFQFYYPDNLEALEQEGARLCWINALTDAALPDLDALYIGGGFPETQAAELAANESFCRSVKTAADNGLPVYAECGGLIYLGRSLRVGEAVYAMTKVLPADFVLEKKPQAHGYTVLETVAEDTFLDKGAVIRGHEFHYSRIVDPDHLPPMAYQVTRGGGITGTGDGLVYKNVLGVYTHLHALGTPQWANAMVRKALEYRKHKQFT
jgi:cobyrinic acid a,c-diamide synthase